jgi:hypothetical protein
MMVTDTRCFLASEYTATKHDVSMARRWVREAVKGLVDAETAYDLSLCAAELVDNARAPRGALSYPRRSREELEGCFWV